MVSTKRTWNWHDWKGAEEDVASGEVREHQYLEMKRDNYGTENSHKKELAKDVAALAVYGGTLVIGIEEDNATGRATRLSPVDLSGQVERIQQICAGRIDPPLPIAVDEISDPSDPSKGLILIDIPASPFAPHQVDGRYVGRADRVVRSLTDAEVVHLHRFRTVSEDAVVGDLDHARQSGEELGLGASALVVAVTPTPLLRPEIIRDELASGSWQSWLSDIIETAEARARALDGNLPLAQLVYSQRGLSFTSRNGVPVPGGRSFRYNGSDGCHLVLEVFDSGAVTLAARGIVGKYPTHRGSEEQELILDQNEAITYTFLGLAIFSGLAQHAGLRCTAGIGLHIDGLHGAVPQRPPSHGFWSSAVPYRDQTYQRVTSATTVELAGDLTGVLDRLYGNLLRGLGIGDPLRKSDA